MENREIKFRGKRIDKNEWIYGSLINRKEGIAENEKEYSAIVIFDKGLDSHYNAYLELEVIPESVGQLTGLKDKNGVDIYEGDIVKGVFNLRTGSRTNGRGRNAYTVSLYDDIEVSGIILFNESLSAFYFETDFKQEYLTSFWRGCGRTKAERDANYLTTSYDSPKDYLHKVISKIEVIGNIHENPELLKKQP